MKTLCRTLLMRITARSAGTSSTNKFDPMDGKVHLNVKTIENHSREVGRFKTNKPPVYVGPYVHPLKVGPDFTLRDNRPCPFTSKEQLEHKKDQIRLTKKIVSLLAQMDEIEKENEGSTIKKLDKATEQMNERPRAKGNKLIRETMALEIEKSFSGVSGGDAEENLQIRLFFQEIEDREWKEAINTIRACKSAHSRQNMLRELLARLLQQQEWETICKKISWDEFSDEVISQLTLKALNQPPNVTPNCYELMVAFYIAQKDYVQASKTLYHWSEQLKRLTQDPTILAKRRDALSASVMYLNMSKREGFPFTETSDSAKSSVSSTSADDEGMDETDSQGTSMSWIIKEKKKPETTNISYISKERLEREWALIDGRVIYWDEKQAIPPSDPQDIFNFLLETRRFNLALGFARHFDFSLVKVLHGLVVETLKLDQNHEILAEGQMFVSAKLSSDPWEVVRGLLDTIIKARSELITTSLHSIAEELLRHKVQLPYWLDSMYTEHDVGAYLQLLSDFGRNEDALKVLIAYTEPMMGKLVGTDVRVFLPYWAIDVVLLRAKEDASKRVKELFTIAVRSLQALQKRVQNFEIANKQSHFAGSRF
ncbi:unnamed protein product, partial [Mesorhabditis belari]|uniref:Uncharacterized protein n=1 Tax=Mesorhabditis belari TaxID=2138241 RepID=A0AAF3FDI8_9BILA